MYDPALDDHHDNRYEDGEDVTGTVADYDPEWLDGWIEVLIPAPTGVQRLTREEYERVMGEVA